MKKVIISIVIVILVVATGGLVYLYYNNTQEINKLEKEIANTKKDNNSIVDDNNDKDDKNTVTSLLKEQTTLESLCGSNTALCNKEIGTINLKDKEYKLSANYDFSGTTSNYKIKIDTKEFDLKEQSSITLRIVNDSFLVIGMVNEWATYSYMVINSSLEELSKISLSDGEKMVTGWNDEMRNTLMLPIEEDGYYYQICQCTNGEMGATQYLKTYKMTVDKYNNWSNKLVGKTEAYCTSQC